MTGSLGSESGLADTGIELRLAPGLDVDCDQLQALCWPMAQVQWEPQVACGQPLHPVRPIMLGNSPKGCAVLAGEDVDLEFRHLLEEFPQARPALGL